MQFPGVLSIDLTQLGEKDYHVSQADRIWLPKKVIQNGILVANPTDCVISIRIADGGNDGLPWGLSDGLMNSLSGEFSILRIKVITPGASRTLYLHSATGVVAGYCNADGLSPQVGASGSTAAGSPAMSQFRSGGPAY